LCWQTVEQQFIPALAIASAVIAHFMKQQKKPETEKAIWDRKSTNGLILIVLLLFGGSICFYFLPGYFRDRHALDYTERTTGTVVSIKRKEILTQGFYGQRISTYSYEILFTYKVNTQSYTNTNNFFNKGKYQKFVSGIYKSNFTKAIDIKYNIKNPKESLILIE